MPGLVRAPAGVLKDGRKLGGLCLGGQTVWRKPLEMADLVAQGHVPMWLKDPRGTPNWIWPNSGYAGAAFNAGFQASFAPTISGQAVNFPGIDGAVATFPGDDTNGIPLPDLRGVRVFVAASYINDGRPSHALLGSSSGETPNGRGHEMYLRPADKVVQLVQQSAATGFEVINISVPALAPALALYELLFDGRRVQIWRDGVFQGSASYAYLDGIYVKRIAGNRSSKGTFKGSMWPIIALIAGEFDGAGNYTATETPEQINAIRRYLNRLTGTQAVMA